ncbi:hypothetical protein HDU93_005787 [Gonapodya sp. JEL0774]|nr:hypothetical protein HDU93_005787 [Gonapodya sp. JEL0774]
MSIPPVGKGMDAGDENADLKPSTDELTSRQAEVHADPSISEGKSSRAGVEGGGNDAKKVNAYVAYAPITTIVHGAVVGDDSTSGALSNGMVETVVDEKGRRGVVARDHGVNAVLGPKSQSDKGDESSGGPETNVMRVTDEHGRAGYLPLDRVGGVFADEDVNVIRTLEEVESVPDRNVKAVLE